MFQTLPPYILDGIVVHLNFGERSSRFHSHEKSLCAKSSKLSKIFSKNFADSEENREGTSKTEDSSLISTACCAIKQIRCRSKGYSGGIAFITPAYHDAAEASHVNNWYSCTIVLKEGTT